MKRTLTLSMLIIVVVVAFSACSKSGTDTTNNPPVVPDPPVVTNYPKPKTIQEMSDQLSAAIKAFTPKIYLDMSAMNIPDNQIDVTALNAYQNATNKDSSLKYAYQVVPNYNQASKILEYVIKYMPYKLGIDPATVPAGTKIVRSYNDLITVIANSPLDQREIPIAITNKNLDLTLMQQVMLSQCGYAYIVYQFNADATSITSAPSPGGLPGAPSNINDCITKINRIKDSATQIVARVITPAMTSDQKLTALYKYVTPTFYDFNYNTPNMLFDSQTAFGVFVNKKAVCGGYSWAFNMLANAAGIQCYNVSGTAGGVGHAWSRANYNGGYYYFDATWDHSLNPYVYFGQTETVFRQKNHTWNNSMINALVSEK